MPATDRLPAPAPEPGAGAASSGSIPRARGAGWTRPLCRRILAVSCAALLVLALLLAFVGTRLVEDRLEVEESSTASTVGRGLAQQFGLALAAGVPFSQLVGVEPFLERAAGFDSRIGYAALLDAEGRVLHAGGRAADGLPSTMPLRQEGEEAGRRMGHVETITAVQADGAEPAGYVLVGVEAGLPPTDLRVFLLRAALALLALLVLLHEVQRALLATGLQRPAEVMARLANAASHGDLSRTTWLSAPGPMGRLLAAVRSRLGAVNTRYHGFLLSAFAARAGHFERPVLREITESVRRLLTSYRLPPVVGALPVPANEASLLRLGCFSVLLGEAFLVPAWSELSLLQPAGDAAAMAFAALPLLIALPLGHWLARRYLDGFARGLVVTAGALLAGSAQLALVTLGTATEIVALRALTGLAIGLALQPLAGGGALAPAFLAALVAGIGPGYLALGLVGADSLPLLAALVTAAAGLLAAQALPARSENEASENDPAQKKHFWSGGGAGLLLPAAFGATAVLAPASMSVGEGPLHFLLIGLVLLAALGLGRLLYRDRGKARLIRLCALILAALLGLSALAASPASWPMVAQLGGATTLLALLLAGAMFTGAFKENGAEQRRGVLAASASLTLVLLLLHLAGLALALVLPALLFLLLALTARPA